MTETWYWTRVVPGATLLAPVHWSLLTSLAPVHTVLSVELLTAGSQGGDALVVPLEH